MPAYQVTVTRTFRLLVGRTADEETAKSFAEGLVDSGQVSDGDWDQEITVVPYEPGGISGIRKDSADG